MDLTIRTTHLLDFLNMRDLFIIQQLNKYYYRQIYPYLKKYLKNIYNDFSELNCILNLKYTKIDKLMNKVNKINAYDKDLYYKYIFISIKQDNRLLFKKLKEIFPKNDEFYIKECLKSYLISKYCETKNKNLEDFLYKNYYSEKIYCKNCNSKHDLTIYTYKKTMFDMIMQFLFILLIIIFIVILHYKSKILISISIFISILIVAHLYINLFSRGI